MVFKYFTVTYPSVVQVVCKRSVISLKIPTLDLVLPLPVFYLYFVLWDWALVWYSRYGKSGGRG